MFLAFCVSAGAQVITTIAGTGAPGYSGDGGQATGAKIDPQGIATDSAGNIYIADYDNYRIRKINTSGIITTIAGTGILGMTGNGGPATAARIGTANGIAVDVYGNVFFSDVEYGVIRKINTSGIITRYAGGGSLHTDSVAATASNISTHLFGLCTDRTGNLYFFTTRVRKVDTFGIITSVAGNSIVGFSGDGGPATAAQLSSVINGIASDSSSNLYIADAGNGRIRRVNTAGIISTVAIDTGWGVACDKQGNVYYSIYGRSIKKIDLLTGPTISRVGNDTIGNSGDGCAASAARLQPRWGLATDRQGNLYFGQQYFRIRKVGRNASFTNGHTQYLTTCAGTADSINTMLAVTNTNQGQVETWSVLTAPAHGTLSASFADTSTGSQLIPTGTYYLPTTGYTGYDTFRVVVSDCASADTTTIYVNVVSSPSAITIVGPGMVCPGATITLTDTVAGGTWQSSNTSIAGIGSASGIVTGVAAGTVTITYVVTLSCGSNTAYKTITVNPLPAAITGTMNVCVAATTTLSDATSGGAWSSSTTTVAAIGSSTGVVSGTSTGTATISYTLPTGCRSMATVTVNPLPGVITGTATVCVSSTTTLGDTTAGGLWSSGTTTIATAGSATGVVAGVSAGTATISYTLPTGCINTRVVTVNPLPAAITGTPVVCAGASVTLSCATSGGAWSTVNTYAIVGSGTGVVTGVGAGVDTVIYTLPTGCKVSRAVTVNALPSSILGIASVCAGSTTILSSATTGGTWQSSNALIATIGSASGIVTGVATGISIITYRLATGCEAYKIVTVNTTPAAITGTANVCAGGTTTLSNGSTGGVWSSANTGIAGIGSGTGIVSGVATGTATISYTLPNGCYVTTNVTVNPLPAGITGALNTCAGATTSLSSTAGGVWSSGSTGIATIGSSSGVVGGIATGMATISYTLPTGCATTTIVTVDASPSVITGSPVMCLGLTTTLSDAVSGGYWGSSNMAIADVGITSGVVTGMAFGTATITYTLLSSGCYTTAVVTVNPAPGPITGTANVCAGSTTTLFNSVPGGAWSSGATSTATAGSTSGIVTGVAAGTTTITYGMGAGCEVTFPITVNPLPAPITGPTTVCIGSTITLSTTTTGMTWSSGTTSVAVIGSTSGILAGLTAGVVICYCPALTTGGVCYRSITVTVNPLPAVITGASGVCVGGSVGLTDATTGGAWTSGAPATGSISTTGVVTGVAAGTALMSYTLPTGCRSTKAMTVNAVPMSILGPGSVCVGGTITLTDGSTGGTWSKSNTNVNIGTASGLVAGVNAGITVITYTLPGGCYTTKTITVNSSPGTIGGTMQVCVGGTVGLTMTTSGGTWSSVTTGVATIGSASGVVSGVSAGLSTISYSVGGGCVATAVVTVNALPGLYSVAGGGSYCAGGAGLHVSLSGSASGTTYQLYQGATIVGGPLAGTGGALDFGPQTGAGTYTVVATNASGCTRVMTGSATIVINPLPGPIGGPSAVCIAGSAGLTMTSSGGTWLSGTPSIATIGSASGIVTGVTIGTTIITYTLPIGCSVTKIVTVSTSPSAIVGASTVCTGATTTLTNAVGGGGWSSSNTSIASVDASLGIVTGVSAGVVTISYSLGSGCTVTRAMTVMPSPAVPTGTMSVCVGSSTTLTDATSGGTWSSSLPGVGSISITGVVTGVSAGTTVVSYTVGSTSSLSGCASGVVVTVNPLPAPITGAGAVCVGGSAVVTTTTTGGAWSTTSSTVTIGSTGIVTGVIAGTATIAYNVGGCIATRIITVNALPTISGGSGVCIGATVALTGTTGGGVWNATGTVTVGTTGLVTGVTAGVGMVTYTLPTGCAATKSVTVNAGPSAITGTASVCVSSTTTLTTTTPGGIWSSGSTGTAAVNSTTGVVTGVAAGVATITYSLGSGCVATRVVTVNPLPGTLSGSGAVCVGGSATLTTGSTSGVWSTDVTGILTIGSASGVVSGIATGTATVSYTLPTGCMATRTVTVTPLPTAITGTPRACIGTTTTLATTPTGGVWTSSNVVIASVGSTTGVVNGLNVGTATISYSLGAGCVVTQMITVNALPPAPTVVGSSTAVCVGATVTLTDATTGGTWSSGNTATATVGSTTGIVTGVAGGSVAISYTVATGCSSTITMSVTAVPPMTGLHNMCAWGDTLNVSDVNPAGTYSSALVTVVNLGGGNGIVTANAPGTATVTYTLSSGCAITRTITVNPLPGSITGSTSVCVGGSAVLTVTTVGGTWSSSATTVATIGSATGVVNGLTTGVSTIRYMLPTGCKVDTVVHVYPLPAPITVMGSTVLVGVSIPFGDPTPGGTWSSGSTAIATVGAGTGMVHGVAPGVANIRYTLPTGCGVGRNVTVIGAPGTGK